MNRKKLKRLLKWAGLVFLGLILLLGVHIYLALRTKAPDSSTRIMARIDIREPITENDVPIITRWMYQQVGVDHVLVNPLSRIVVFTFSPMHTNADRIATAFQSALPYTSSRFKPSTEILRQGCPAMASSISDRIRRLFKQIF